VPYLQPYLYYDQHHNAYGLKYQVGCSISYPIRIVEFSGPYKGGRSDVGIFRSTLLPLLEERELVMCDKAYLAEKRCWTPPKGKFITLSREDKGKSIVVTKIRQVNERVIGRLSEWGVMDKKWNLDFEFHGECANGAAKLTQLQLYTNPLT
jgi:hypothetical protein